MQECKLVNIKVGSSACTEASHCTVLLQMVVMVRWQQSLCLVPSGA